MLKLAKVNRKLSIYSNLRLTIKWIHIYVEIRKLQILVLSNLYLEKLVVKHLSSLEDWKSQFCHAAAKKCCGSGNLLICFLLLFVSWQKWKIENIIIPQWFLNSFTIFNSLYFLIHEIWYFHHICSIVNIQVSSLFMLGPIEDRAHNMRNMCITCFCIRILNFTCSKIFNFRQGASITPNVCLSFCLSVRQNKCYN